MDQDAFFTLTDEDLVDVNLHAAPTSGVEYLKQVALGRRALPAVVVADVKLKKIADNQIVDDSRAKSSRITAPPQWWTDKQRSDFSDLRQKLRRLKARMKKISIGKTKNAVNFPSLNDEQAWKTFCFHKWQTAATISIDEDQIQDVKRIHRGTPPLVTVLLSMDQPRVIDLLEFQVAWFVEEGHSEARMQWLFALICVLEKPLDPETCSTLRDLAKNCIKLREECFNESNDEHLIRSYNWFINIVANYFDQKDLADA